MTDKISLTNLASLQNDTSAVDKINGNNAAIVTAVNNTLSRDGTTPNTMLADLDMNSNHILNLPAPSNTTEPLRVIDATTLNGGGIVTVSPLPAGGATGQHLVKNSATNYDVGWVTPSSLVNLTTTGSSLSVAGSNVDTNALNGDVSTSAKSFTTTITANAVTGPKFRQSAGLSVVGNNTAGTANVVDVTGTANQILAVNGAASSMGFTTVAGDLTNSSGTFTIAPGVVTGTKTAANTITNSNLAQAGAATLKGNPTAALANEQDFTIQSLTNLSSPDANNDKVLIYDHTAGTFKYSTPGQIASSATAGVSALNSLTGSLTLAAGTGITVGNAGTTVTVNNSGVTKVVKQIFTVSGTYTPTAGMQYCIIESVGGGGGGGGGNAAASKSSAGAGGGGGGYSRTYCTAATIGASKTVTIGAGGAGAAPATATGVAGGDSTVGTLCTGKGGSGGQSNNNVPNSTSHGGNGGVAGAGDFTVTGHPGGNAISFDTLQAGFGGNGGSSIFGGGGIAGLSGSNSTGDDGHNYGGGGAGGQAVNSNSAVGGSGAPGIVVITEFVNA